MSDDMWYTLSRNPEYIKSFEEQAAKDWERILLKRAAELKKGTQFSCCSLEFLNFCTKHGTYLKPQVIMISHFSFRFCRLYIDLLCSHFSSKCKL